MNRLLAMTLLAVMSLSMPALAEDESGDGSPSENPDGDTSGQQEEGGCGSTGNPVILSTGNKVKEELDFEASYEAPFRFARSYNKNSGSRLGLFGLSWFTPYDVSLRFHFSGGGYCDVFPGQTSACMLPSIPSTNIDTVTRFTADGSQITYDRNATTGTWLGSQPSTTEVISRNADGSWKVVSKSGAVENFNSAGFVTSSTEPTGLGLTYAYTSNRLQSVTHSNGRKIQFAWTNGRVTTVTDPAGNPYTYGYTNGYLSQVTEPGPPAVIRTYHYESSIVGALTGISVGGVRYSNYDYYADGRVFHSGLANGVERDTFAYGANPDGTTYTQVTNALGAVKKYTYRTVLEDKKLIRVDRSGVVNCPNAAAQTFYDVNGFIDYELDYKGNKTDYTYTAQGLLDDKTTGINPSFPGKQRYTDFIWDAVKRRLVGEKVYGASTSDPISEKVIEYYTDASTTPGRIKSISNYNRTAYGTPGQLRKTTFTYTLNANKTLLKTVVDGPRTDVNDITTFNYSTIGDLTSIVDPLGHQYLYAAYMGLGLPTSTTDPNSVVTQYAYDGRGRVKTRTVVLTGGNRVTTTSYHRLGGVETVVRPDNSRLVTSYDDAGRPTGSHMNGYQKIDYSRNLLGNITRRRHTNWCPEGVICSKVLVTSFQKNWEFDQLGRMTAEVGAHSQRKEFLYDDNGNVRETKQIGTTNRVETFNYGPNDELLSSVNALTQTTTYTYDGAGRIATITDPKNLTTRYKYDGLGNLVEVSSPDTGTTTWQYDAAGNRTSMLRADGTSVSYVYDALERMKSATSGARVDSYTYDTCTNGKLKQCQVSSAGTSDSYTYTQTGKLASQASIINGTTFTTSRAYDSLDRLKQISYPGGLAIKYEYNNQDQVTAVKSVLSGVTTILASDFQYNYFGPAFTYNRGNGSVYEMGYDLNHRPYYNGPNLMYEQTEFDEVLSITDDATPNLTQTFAYDSLSRLKTVTSNSGNQAFTFDANGSRETHTWGGVIDDYVPQSTSNRIGSVAGTRSRTYTFDNRGNTKTEGGWRGTYIYTYDDVTNRLSSVQKGAAVTQYVGNGLNQRVRKTGPGGNFSYLYSPDGMLLAETAAGASSMSSFYVWLEGKPFALVRGGAIYYLVNDHLGRPRQVQNSTGAVVWAASNFAYDRVVTTNSLGGLNLAFPGQYFDAESGLYYNWNRYYDATAGRYLQSDPIGLASGLNTYIYVGANPLVGVDPLGLNNIVVGGGMSGIVGLGGEGYAGLYISGTPFDIGLFGSGGVGYGANAGINGFVGFINGPASNLSTPTMNYNVSTGYGSYTVMTDPVTGEFAGMTAGPAARGGASRTYSQGEYYGLRDLFTDAFEFFDNLFGDGCP